MNVLKEFGIFAAGAVVGIIATQTYFKQKYDKETKEKIEQMKHFHEIELEKVREKNEAKRFASLEKDAEVKRNYSSVSSLYISKDEMEEKLDDMSKTEHPEDDIPMEPYAITNDEFVYEEDEYEKIPLSFYLDDEALVDENEELAEVDQTIGKECYQILCAQKPDSYWVRNPRISCDFEIFAIQGSYKEEILGED